VAEQYSGGEAVVRVTGSQSNGRLQSFLRTYGTILKEEYIDGSVVMDVKLRQNQVAQLKSLGAKEIVNCRISIDD
jgi:predicted metalloenzyme YecM